MVGRRLVGSDLRADRSFKAGQRKTGRLGDATLPALRVLDSNSPWNKNSRQPDQNPHIVTPTPTSF